MPYPVGLYVTRRKVNGIPRWMFYLEHPVAELAGERKYAVLDNSWEANPAVATSPNSMTGKRLDDEDLDQIVVGELQTDAELNRYHQLTGAICNHNNKSFILEALRMLTEANLVWNGAFSQVAMRLTDKNPSPRSMPPARLPAAPSGRAPTLDTLRSASRLPMTFSLTAASVPPDSSRQPSVAADWSGYATVPSSGGIVSLDMETGEYRVQTLNPADSIRGSGPSTREPWPLTAPTSSGQAIGSPHSSQRLPGAGASQAAGPSTRERSPPTAPTSSGQAIGSPHTLQPLSGAGAGASHAAGPSTRERSPTPTPIRGGRGAAPAAPPRAPAKTGRPSTEGPVTPVAGGAALHNPSGSGSSGSDTTPRHKKPRSLSKPPNAPRKSAGGSGSPAPQI